eukprot:CAMPEP_0198322114 /NCGR_PEP_ID=MMETSP1450-20131203/10668_1 /TAXON_ID=753684 ORGANISM="Madagascaria erythrocladiodes, Strain CCMP3234" /NCGR_SAMPLE_ID=MMETSP1450 /ASSEMBLY_ACC=CAM_ASM_001115 /LENGTH=65 /DNA_ID=CAMNT_0044025711 /DNA_START=54 /DNA_END=251 /DNA_ORIENTATION=+
MKKAKKAVTPSATTKAKGNLMGAKVKHKATCATGSTTDKMKSGTQLAGAKVAVAGAKVKDKAAKK